eukprot:CAMPEP_0169416524 /NCGR_PEP_ID=MMETSP1017-20121227/63170_1 /TAXON_ID=342587 /ORGANISM="Karlodinium micrum, Strain CCMP2283" /LENGTH=1481 /DNA_ID=CAMNT_0009524481 /DNA_START=87 /DNA_END=4531 /DNA_ORIENTATION=+
MTEHSGFTPRKWSQLKSQSSSSVEKGGGSPSFRTQDSVKEGDFHNATNEDSETRESKSEDVLKEDEEGSENAKRVENDEEKVQQEDAKLDEELQDMEDGMKALPEETEMSRSLKFEEHRPRELSLGDDDTAHVNNDQAQEYALVSDLNQKIDEFSQYMAEEMERLDGAICKQMEDRMQEFVAETMEQGVNDLVQGRFSEFEREVQRRIEEKIAETMSDMAVGGLMSRRESGDEDGLGPAGGFAEVNIVAPQGSKTRSESITAAPEDEQQHQVESKEAEAAEKKEGSLDVGDPVSSTLSSLPRTPSKERDTPPVNESSRKPSKERAASDSRHPPIINASSRHNSTKQDHPANPEIIFAIKSLQLKLGPLEEALTELKPLRLQVPALQGEMENLSESVSRICQSLEDDNGNRRCSTHLSETWSDNGDQGAMAGAHSPEDQHETRANKSHSTHGVHRAGSIGRYMSQANVQHDQSKIDTLTKRVEKLENDTIDPVERTDVEQLLSILEDRVKELDTDYRVKIHELDMRVGLQQSLEEREAASAQKVYESWDLDNQVDVILSVVQGEMRNVRMEINDMIKTAIEDRSPKSATQFPLHDGGRGPKLESGGGGPGRRRERRESGSRSPSPSFKEQEEKVKRLQECYQQCTLKIAGLKSGNRHAEQQVAHSLEQIKKLAADLENFGTIALRNECRLDYLTLHAHSKHHDDEHKEVEKPTTFQNAIGRAGLAHTTRNTLATATPETPAHRGHSPMPRGQSPMPRGSCRPHDHPDISRELTRSSTRGMMMRRSSHMVPNTPTTPHAPHSSHVRSGSPHGQENADPNTALSHAEQIDVNSGRLWRLGKKVNDLDNEVSADFKKMKDEISMMDQKMNMLVTFLPRRLRRMVEGVLTVHKNPEDEGEKKEKGLSKHVVISEKAPDVRTFNADPDTGNLPWQCVGEPDQKWAWCLQPRNDMGRDLARQFELIDDEKNELAEQLGNSIETLRQEFQMRLDQWRPPRQVDQSSYESNSRTTPPTSPLYGNPWGGGASSEAVEKINRRLDKAVLPQMATLEDRLERLVKDVIEVKSKQEADRLAKADKEEMQLLKMRLQVFEKFDPKQIAAQVENLEVDGKHFLHLIDQLAEQCRKIESYAAHRQDMTKCKAEVTQVKAELHKLQGEQKEISTSVFNSNRQLSTIVLETKTNLEKHLAKLEVEKVSMTEYSILQEKIVKLDSSMRDNRQILSGSTGGADMSQVVKRIILNMEDKILMLEKKMDLVLEGRQAAEIDAQKQGENPGLSLPPSRSTSRRPSLAPGTAGAPLANDVGVAQLGGEIAAISEAVTILKQEVTLSKVNMDSIREQGAQASELAQRLNILVESPDGDTGTTLSLNRVQVMVAAAARQLVAGSKWVTQDIFDTRLHELRKECIGFMRQVQTHVDEMHSQKLQPQILSNLGPKKLPSVVADKQGRQGLEDSGIGFGVLPKRHVGTAPAAPGKGIEGSVLKTPLSARR